MLPLMDRAIYIEAMLEYATYVGPALGRALMRMNNPDYVTLLMLRLLDSHGSEGWGLWPDQEPSPDYRANPTGLITHHVRRDRGERRLFPDWQYETITDWNLYLSKKLYEAQASLATCMRKLPLVPPPSVPGEFPRCRTALEIACRVPTQRPRREVVHPLLTQDEIRRYDYAAHCLGWEPVTLLPGWDDLPMLPPTRLIRRADQHSRQLRGSTDRLHQLLGRRSSELTLPYLVFAGSLIDPENSSIGMGAAWPFDVPDAPPGVTRRVGEDDAQHTRRLMAELGTRLGGMELVAEWVATGRAALAVS